MKKALVVYYSWSYGNTERIAERLAKTIQADIACIDTVVPYIGGHEEVVQQGQDEVRAHFQPPIKPLAVNAADYDIIAIGTPTWWYTMAPAILTYLSSHDWAGKTVIPFMTNAGWTGHVIADMKKVCKDATVAAEMEIMFSSDDSERDRMLTSEKDLSEWLAQVKAICEG